MRSNSDDQIKDGFDRAKRCDDGGLSSARWAVRATVLGILRTISKLELLLYGWGRNAEEGSAILRAARGTVNTGGSIKGFVCGTTYSYP